MSRSYLSIIWLSIFLACTSCAVQTIEPKRISQCNIDDSCVVEGQLIATEGMGRIQDDTGCIAVALPSYVTDDWNLQQVKASGKIYKAPDYEGFVTYKILERIFDAEACYSGLAMYVDDIELVR